MTDVLLHEPASDNPARRGIRDARGFSLMEAIVATVIAVLAAIGLAYTFGIGRGNINRFEAARLADARAQGRMEFLNVLMESQPASESLLVGVHPATPVPFYYHGLQVGTEYWRVDAAPDSVPAAVRGQMSLLTVEVAWSLGGLRDTARYSRVFGR